MYKVFINDRPIILTDSLIKTYDFLHFSFENIALDEIVHKLKHESMEGVVLICRDLESCWQNFQTHFKKIIAAGGLVVNKEKEFLFIFRVNRWDLPKGRIEVGENLEETAIREVQEECGISKIKIDDFLLTTYHLFSHNKKHKLKETHWYLMNSDSQEHLTPQVEEGITKVEFKNQEATHIALENTYANIKLVFESYHNREP